MKTVGIIAEYNPFHNGHAYHIHKSRELTGADFVIIAMSGDFVQRGAPSIFDKYTRTKMALSCGADLVLELPVRYATGSAEYFAAGAVSLLHNLGVADALCFGGESDQLSFFTKISEVLFNEPEFYSDRLRRHLSCGLSYPTARAKALLDYCQQTDESGFFCDAQNLTAFLASPNNILGIEYCKALHRLSSSIKPVVLQRVESDYHQETLSEQFSSATAIRRHLADQDLHSIKNQLPPEAFSLLKEAVRTNRLSTLEDYSLLLKYKLMCETPDSLTQYQDMSVELANRIYSKLNQFESIPQFIQELKTKEVTYTRISRALLHVLLNIQSFSLAEDSQDIAPYARILGFRKDSASLLGQIKKKSCIPLISKLADRQKLLSGDGLAMLEEDIWCANLYESVVASHSPEGYQHEITKPIVIC